MATHYELLRINSDATVEEIISAYDKQYHQLSQIATRHHDRSEQLMAEQKRLDLDKAFAILNDPEKRAEYDAKLGSGQTGGLFDPEVSPSDDLTAPLPLTPPPSPSSSQKDVREGTWVCPTCKKPYPKGTKHCKEDGRQLGVICPSCRELTEAAAAYCEHCGVNLKQAIFDRQRRQEQTERERALREKQARERQLREERQRLALEPLRKRADSAWTWTMLGCVGVIFIWYFAAIPWLVAFFTANGVLNSSQGKYDDVEIREKARKARIWSGVSLAVMGIWVAFSCALWMFMMVLASLN